MRSFRLSATLAGAQLVTTVVDVRKQVHKALSQAQFQRDAEARKGQRAASQVIHSPTSPATGSLLRQGEHKHPETCKGMIKGMLH